MLYQVHPPFKKCSLIVAIKLYSDIRLKYAQIIEKQIYRYHSGYSGYQFAGQKVNNTYEKRIIF